LAEKRGRKVSDCDTFTSTRRGGWRAEDVVLSERGAKLLFGQPFQRPRKGPEDQSGGGEKKGAGLGPTWVRI